MGLQNLVDFSVCNLSWNQSPVIPKIDDNIIPCCDRCSEQIKQNKELEIEFSNTWQVGTYILVEIGTGECLGKSINQASTKVQKGLLVCTSSFPEAGAAVTGAAGIGGGVGRQAEAKLVFGHKYDQELCGAEKTITFSDKSFWLWQPPKCPPRRDGKAKWHIHAMEHCWAVNRKEVLIHTWRTPKNTQRVISFIGKTLNRQVHRDRKQVSGCQGLRAGESGSDWGFRASFQGDGNVLGLQSEHGCTTL